MLQSLHAAKVGRLAFDKYGLVVDKGGKLGIKKSKKLQQMIRRGKPAGCYCRSSLAHTLVREITSLHTL